MAESWCNGNIMHNSLSYRTFFTDHWQPLHQEHDEIMLTISGEIPAELQGIYYKNGPSARFLPRGFHHLVDGDGMVHAFVFANNTVRYRNKWVRTQCFNLESQAERSLFGSFMFPFTGDSSVHQLNPGQRSKANTNVIRHAQRLLALEESGVPYELDPHTLMTKGTLAFDFKKITNLTAHPKLDPETGELHCINWHTLPEQPCCTYLRFSSAGEITHYVEIAVPYRAIIHDFAITERHIIIPVFPLVVDLPRALANKNARLIEWHPQLATHVAIMTKDFPHDIVWFELPACYALHTVNAFSENNKIVLDLVVHDTPPVFIEPNAQQVITVPRAQLVRWEFNLATKSFCELALDDAEFGYNFPRIDERHFGQPYSHVFACGGMVTVENNILLESTAVIAFCQKSRCRTCYYPGAHYQVAEPIVITTATNSYLMTLCYNQLTQKSELLILNAHAIAQGPLATVYLPHAIPCGFHGNWYQL